jgi:Excisionase from transposon Tn916.
MTMAMLSDKRLLSMEEFRVYAGLGGNVARNVAESTGAIFRVGRRVLVDRVKFDRFCDDNSEIDSGI